MSREMVCLIAEVLVEAEDLCAVQRLDQRLLFTCKYKLTCLDFTLLHTSICTHLETAN